jgi:hypothetical protein
MLNPASSEATLARRLRAKPASPQIAPLLAVAAPLALLAVAAAAASPGLVIQDTWLSLVSGREVAGHGLPSVDHLAALTAGHRWVDQQWLAQLLLYGAARVGGIGAAVALCLLAIVAAFGLAASTAHRRGASPRATLVFLVLSVAAAPWGLQLRAQALALPLFAGTLWLLARDPDAKRRSTLWVLPLLCVWANVHGTVVLGVALVAAWALQALVRRTSRGPAAACLVLAPVSLLASPYATALPGYYRLMLLNPPFGRQIREWQRTTPSILTAVFFALAAYTLVLVVVRRRRVGAFDALVLALALATGLEAIRGIVWFGLAAAALLPALATRRPGAVRFEGRAAAALVGAALVAVAGAVVWAAVRPATDYETRFPAGLLGVVRDRAAAGDRVFANEATSDWLLWELPLLRGRVAYDVRFELDSPAQIRRLTAWRDLRPGWRAATTGYALVVDDPKHVARLLAGGGWRRVYSAPKFAVAERITR